MMKRRHFVQLAGGYAIAAPLGAQPAQERGYLIGSNIATDPEAFAAAGYGFFELPVTRWINPRSDDEAFRKRLAELKQLPLPALAWNGFLPADLKAVGPQVTKKEAIIEWGKIAFDRIRKAGGKVVTFGSGGARACPEGFPLEKARSQLARTLGELAAAADNAGVIFAVENLNRSETNVGVSLEECLAIVEESGSGHLKLTADIHHMLVEGEGPEILGKAAARIAHCHIAEKAARSQPGIDGDDFGPYLRPLIAGGYEGMITFECKWQGAPAEAAAPAIKAFRQQLR